MTSSIHLSKKISIQKRLRIKIAYKMFLGRKNWHNLKGINNQIEHNRSWGVS